MKKIVYLVRHGETANIREGSFQSHTTPLNEKGHADAALLVEYFKDIPVEAIISSELTRAQETIQPLAQALNLPVISEALFNERKDPAEIENKSRSDPEVQKIVHLMRENAFDPAWHFSDEENYHDMLTRAGKALRSLEERAESTIVVCTHDKLLNYLMAAAAYPEMPFEIWYHQLYLFTYHTNCGVTVLIKDEEDSVGSHWRLHHWNQTHHLDSNQHE